MQGYTGLNAQHINALVHKVGEKLGKSFQQANNFGIGENGKAGLEAIHMKERNMAFYDISRKESDFVLTKDIKDVPSDDLAFIYNVKHQNGDAYADYALFENGIGKQAMPNYNRSTVELKVYGAKTAMSHAMGIINKNKVFAKDLEDEQRTSVMTSLAKNFEQDSHFGQDYYINSAGNFEKLAFNRSNQSVERREFFRNATGLQNWIRTLDLSYRNISPEDIGYGNIQSVTYDAKGQNMDQAKLDFWLQAINEGGGATEVVHCTYGQARAFREGFFAMQRGNIGTGFSINGPEVNGDVLSQQVFPVDTLVGTIKFKPSRWRKLQMKKIPQSQQHQIGGGVPTPTVPVLASVPNQGTSFKAGENLKFAIQAKSIDGLSSPVYVDYTVTADGEGVRLDIPAHPTAEAFHIYCTPPKAAPTHGDLHFVGRCIAVNGTTVFLHKEAMMSGLDALVFCPPKGWTGEMGAEPFFRAVLGGQAMYELDLAFLGAHYERSFLSYFNYICIYGRTFGLVDNVGQDIVQAKSALDLILAP